MPLCGTFRLSPSTVKIKVFCPTLAIVKILRSQVSWQVLVVKVIFLAVINSSVPWMPEVFSLASDEEPQSE